MSTFVVLFLVFVLFSCTTLPFPNWKSFTVVVVATITEKQVNFRQRLSMAGYLTREVLLLPVWAVFWFLDEIIYFGYHKEKIEKPIFIFSQPRSGTTFLLRTLAEDENTFISIKHMEWRYPYISFWKLIDVLNLRGWLENKSYWPNNELGKKCSKIHFHVLGNHEEFGIFLEERFFHHYFVFRRFPFKKVIDRVSQFFELSDREKNRMIDTFTRTVKKVYYYRGNGEIFLTKENECVDFCKALITKFPDAKILFIVREPGKVLASYTTMSLTCTEVKHGVDPRNIDGWDEANIEFRRQECKKYVDFCNEIQTSRISVLIPFTKFTTDVLDTTLSIYKKLNLPVSTKFRTHLEQLQLDQNKRKSGYENPPCDAGQFDFYAEFVEQANRQATI